MSSSLAQALAQTTDRLRALHKLAMQQFSISIKAFEDLDQDLADETAGKADIPEGVYYEIEEAVFNAIAEYSPDGEDLRRLTAFLHAAISLARIARYARKISETVGVCDGLDHFKELESIPYLAEIANSALEISMNAVLEGDLSEIDSLEKLEAQSDHEITCMFDEISEFLQTRRDISTLAMCYVIVGRYCERAADEAISIAEAAVYMVKNKREKLGQVYKDADEEEYLP
jgi:phosphate uptake regulator